MPTSNLIETAPPKTAVTAQALAAMQAYWQAAQTDSGMAEMHLTGSGAIAALETKLKQHYGKHYALCVSNATTGLLAISLALELQGVDFVTTPVTYGASLAGWLLRGNRPIFAEVDPNTLILDPEAVRQQITPQTQAILAVDMMGNPCDSEALRQVADEYDLWYIADAAQSLGAYRQGQPASSQADALVVSFTVGKSLFAGEGGAILTDNAELYQKLVWWTQHPDRQRRDLSFHLTNQFGLNGRIHPLAAVVANATFEASLAHLHQRQTWNMAVLDILNDLGLTQPTTFREDDILPAFFRLCIPWRDDVLEPEVVRACEEQGYAVAVATSELPWLLTDPAWVAQHGHLSEGWCLRRNSLNQYCFVEARGLEGYNHS